MNEVALARGASTRAIRVAVAIDGDPYITHTADGVIIATATGSTAYSLAAGGPILVPQSDDLVLTPVAPHLHVGRSIVLPGTSVIRLQLAGDREGMLAIDGQSEYPFQVGDAVDVMRSEKRAHFARLGSPNYFFSALATRFR
jgi:NAD+ kinase